MHAESHRERLERLFPNLINPALEGNGSDDGQLFDSGPERRQRRGCKGVEIMRNIQEESRKVN